MNTLHGVSPDRSVGLSAIVLIAAASIAPGDAAASPDWLQFRGPAVPEGSVSGSRADPGAKVVARADEVSWTPERSWTWRVDLPGRGVSSPILVGDRVYLTASSGPGGDILHVLCLSAEDGRRLWERRFRGTGRTACHPKTCAAAPTPASDGKRIFAFYSTNDLFALNLDGDLLWARGLTWDYPNASSGMGMASSPVVAAGVLVVQVENQSESFAAGISIESGENLWKVARPAKPSWSSPLWIPGSGSDPGTVVLQSWDLVSGLDPTNGQERWQLPGATNCIPSSAVRGETIFLAAEGLTALRPRAGESTPEVLWRSSKLRAATSSPLFHEGFLYTINSAGVLTCGRPETGDSVWQLRLKGKAYSSTPVASGGRLFSASEEGLFQVVTVGEKGEVLGTLDLGETILATPAISRGALFLRSDAHLWKFGG